VIRTLSDIIGEQLTTHLRAIADANPLLKGIIDRVDFNATTHGVRDLADDRSSIRAIIVSHSNRCQVRFRIVTLHAPRVDWPGIGPKTVRRLSIIALAKWRPGKGDENRLSVIPIWACAGNRLDVHAYRCVGVAARNGQNNCVHRPYCGPVVTRRVRSKHKTQHFVPRRMDSKNECV